MSRQLKIITPHGRLTTPFFMPDATRGYVRAVDNEDLEKVGVKAMVVNTLHLYLQPGLKIIKKAGGIHQFMNWQRPLLSDSGGYQVFSLIRQPADKNKNSGKILKDKVIFKSPLDGSAHELTPEKSIQIQFDLGTDMLVCLDDCPPNDYDKKAINQSVERTIAWARRCRMEYDKQARKRKIKPLLFGVIQGGKYKDLRKHCAKELIKLNFDGYGFGARHLDSDKKFLGDVLKYTANLIPKNKIRFALGIGAPEDIVRCYKMGWDIFDCVIPTREARHGKLYLQGKTINIMNAKYKNDFSLINKQYSRAYLHHLFKNNELTGRRLATLNNLKFYNELMKQLKAGIM